MDWSIPVLVGEHLKHGTQRGSESRRGQLTLAYKMSPFQFGTRCEVWGVRCELWGVGMDGMDGMDGYTPWGMGYLWI